jgi:energy-coupling factor transport system permease protein
LSSLHPASLILLGFAFLLAASSRGGTLLLLLCIAVAGLALLRARRQFAGILRRSRWLLLTMLVLFGWMTLGTPVSGLPGATREGLQLAVDNIARMLIAIAVVALLVSHLAPSALVSGLRSLLVPLAPLGDFRDRLAVRLMLTLQEVDAACSGVSAAPAPVAFLELPAAGRGPADYLAAIGSTGLLLFAVFV